ncbi:MAG: glycosyltransferase [Ferruginibacter sp.]
MKYSAPISVVMPCYNSGKYVSAAIESILNQTYSQFEFIIVNDGSIDNSCVEIKKHNDPRIRFFNLKENKGNYFARNYGIRLAKGKYICVMDADDIAYPNRLEVQSRYLNFYRQVGVIGSQGELMAEDGTLLNGKIGGPCVSWAQLKIFLLKNNVILHPSLMARSCLIKKHHLLYNEKYRYSADFDFVSRCASLFPVRNIDDRLIMYRLHDTQISTKDRALQSEYADQIRIERLKTFKINFSGNEEKMYVSIMKGRRLSSVGVLEEGVSLFNKILSANLKLKIYNHRLLYEFFAYTLSTAKERLEANKKFVTD